MHVKHWQVTRPRYATPELYMNHGMDVIAYPLFLIPTLHYRRRSIKGDMTVRSILKPCKCAIKLVGKIPVITTKTS